MYLCGNRYKVLGRLGEGGFGSVYLAEDQFLKKTWAIKDIGNTDDISYSLVRAEVSVLAKASHPGIVRITDVFVSEGHIYMVMDHIKGMNLKELMRSGKKLSERMLYSWAVEICDAVSYLHQMHPPVIICDIKPQNIMVKPDGHIVLIDFGAAIPSAPVSAGNAPAFASRKYASPEQLKGDKATVKSDIYSLGRVLEYISGKDRPLGISAVIKRCTMNDPRLRYRNVKAVKRSLAVAANMTRIAFCLALFFIGGCLLLIKAGENTRLINENAMTAQAYEQGLMCFYELGDYKAAGGYLSRVPVSEYPEARYYIELSALITEKDPDEDLDRVLKAFEGFNEKDVFPESTDRYIKNSFCISKIYISYDTGDDRYDHAYRIVSHILKLCRKAPASGDKSLRQYEGDALRLIINLLILQGRSDKDLTTDCYHEAIGYIDELISLNEDNDKKALISRYMDKASLYTELGEYDNALKVYDSTEAGFPFDPGIKYFSHLSLLMQSGASKASIRSLWSMIEQVPGIEADAGYDKMKERMEGYLTDS